MHADPTVGFRVLQTPLESPVLRAHMPPARLRKLDKVYVASECGSGVHGHGSQICGKPW
jgi:hypothetical protein